MPFERNHKYGNDVVVDTINESGTFVDASALKPLQVTFQSLVLPGTGCGVLLQLFEEGDYFLECFLLPRFFPRKQMLFGFGSKYQSVIHNSRSFFISSVVQVLPLPAFISFIPRFTDSMFSGLSNHVSPEGDGFSLTSMFMLLAFEMSSCSI